MIPKRAIGALITTVFALVLLLSFKTPAAPGFAASTTSDTAIVGEPAAPAAPTAIADTGSTSTDTGTATTPTPTDANATSGSLQDGTVTGETVATRFGDVQVQVTISGGTIVDVTALELPSGDRRSAQISDAVEPVLREEALAAQSAEIDLLSGATYTSRAYAQSLQSALDQARA
jgi:uncharacterized protein with FMN-binding domain